MKKIVLIAVALVATTFAFGQRTFEGEKQINGGLGLVSAGWGVPIYAGFDYGVTPEITVGGIVSYSSKTYNYDKGYTNKGTWISIGAKGDYHFNTLLEMPDEWDFYGGATLAYNSFFYSDNWEGNHSGESANLSLGLQVGGRYYFNENWAVNAELGGGTFASGVKIGVTYKF